MSHDRGCFKCGNESWDYTTCVDKDCPKKHLFSKPKDEKKPEHEMG